MASQTGFGTIKAEERPWILGPGERARRYRPGQLKHFFRRVSLKICFCFLIVSWAREVDGDYCILLRLKFKELCGLSERGMLNDPFQIV